MFLEERVVGGLVGLEKSDDDVTVSWWVSNSVEGTVDFVVNGLMEADDVMFILFKVHTVESSIDIEGLGLCGGESVHGDLFEHGWSIPVDVG